MSAIKEGNWARLPTSAFSPLPYVEVDEENVTLKFVVEKMRYI